MKKRHLVNLLLLMSLSISFVGIAAAPISANSVTASSASKSDSVRLVVENKSSGSLYIWLQGKAFYYFELQSGESELFSVARGEYTYKFKACGDTVTGTIDLTTQSKLVMPVCGGRATSQSRAAGTYDISSQIKIVKVGFENDSGSRLFIIMTGPTTYVFTFEKGEEKDYTIAKGDYEVQVWGCGRYGTRNFTAFKGKTLVLDCPKP